MRLRRKALGKMYSCWLSAPFALLVYTLGVAIPTSILRT